MDGALLIVAVVLAVPLGVLAIECLAAVRSVRAGAPPGDAGRGPCAILVPAHDEEAGLTATLKELKAQLRIGDRLVVVADNCSDGTAAVARAAGAEVAERHDPDHRGKGYALAFGVEHLRAAPPEIVVIVDADCRTERETIERLVIAAANSNRPVQAAYLMNPPAGAGPRTRLSGWAFRFKNFVRPLGLHNLGVPCLLTGSGMAFPWTILRDAPLASGNIVEDMRLGVDLALAGHPPRFEPPAVILGELPSGARAASVQRTRWEHGHLRTLLTQSPRLLAAAIVRGRPALAGLALELAVPPLSILAIGWVAAAVAGCVHWYVGGSGAPVSILLASGGIAVAAMLLAWWRFGRDLVSPGVLLAAPWYALAKLPIYLSFLVRPQRAWVRTARSPLPPGQSPP